MSFTQTNEHQKKKLSERLNLTSTHFYNFKNVHELAIVR